MRTGYCQRGHLVAGDNLLVLVRRSGRTERRCLACAQAAVARWVARDADRQRARRAAARAAAGQPPDGRRVRRSVCRRGLHPMDDPANVYVRPNGERECRACRAAARPGRSSTTTTATERTPR